MRWLFVGIVALNLVYFGWRLVGVDDVRPSVAVEPMPAPYPASLKLLAERSVTEATALVVPAVPVVPAPPKVSGCPALGPVLQAQDGARIVSILAAHAVNATVVGQDTVAPAPMYWVYLPSVGSRSAAMRRLRELQAKGIESFVVTDGADANAISLGTFASRDSAYGVQARMKAAGYDVSVREQARNAKPLWVVLADPKVQGFLEYVPAALRKGLRIERKPCVR